MVIYIVCFITSTLFLWLATKHCNKEKINSGEWVYQKPKMLWTSIGLLIPCVLAALRDTKVGSDVEFYGVSYFNAAIKSSGFKAYVMSIGGNKTDTAYDLLNYIVSRFTSNIGWLFFFVELIVIVCIFFACWNLRAIAPTWKCMLFFYFTFYNMTLSTIRQSCACAIVFLGISFAISGDFKKKSVIKAIISIFVAMLFHVSAAFAFLLIILCYGIIKGKFKPLHIGIFSIIIGLSVSILSNIFLKWFYKVVAIFSSKYVSAVFLSNMGVGADGYTLPVLLGCFVSALAGWNIVRQKDNVSVQINRMLLGLNLINVIMMILISRFVFVPRLMYYIQFMYCIVLSETDKLVKKDSFNRRFMFVFTVVVVFVYWLLFYIVGNVHGTYPYVLR